MKKQEIELKLGVFNSDSYRIDYLNSLEERITVSSKETQSAFYEVLGDLHKNDSDKINSYKKIPNIERINELAELYLTVGKSSIRKNASDWEYRKNLDNALELFRASKNIEKIIEVGYAFLEHREMSAAENVFSELNYLEGLTAVGYRYSLDYLTSERAADLYNQLGNQEGILNAGIKAFEWGRVRDSTSKILDMITNIQIMSKAAQVFLEDCEKEKEDGCIPVIDSLRLAIKYFNKSNNKEKEIEATQKYVSYINHKYPSERQPSFENILRGTASSQDYTMMQEEYMRIGLPKKAMDMYRKRGISLDK
jgi:hypothetical protein